MHGGIFRHRQPKGPAPATARPNHHRATPRLYKVRWALPTKTLRATGLFREAFVGSTVTARCGDAPVSPPRPRTKSPVAGPISLFGRAAAAREGGCARGCKSHPSNWTVHDGTAWCLSARKERRGVSSPGIEPTGLNEGEPQPMSLERNKTGVAEPLACGRRPMLVAWIIVSRDHLRRGRRGKHVGKGNRR